MQNASWHASSAVPSSQNAVRSAALEIFLAPRESMAFSAQGKGRQRASLATLSKTVMGRGLGVFTRLLRSSSLQDRACACSLQRNYHALWWSEERARGAPAFSPEGSPCRSCIARISVSTFTSPSPSTSMNTSKTPARRNGNRRSPKLFRQSLRIL